jgi:hypothetical protein
MVPRVETLGWAESYSPFGRDFVGGDNLTPRYQGPDRG